MLADDVELLRRVRAAGLLEEHDFLDRAEPLAAGLDRPADAGVAALPEGALPLASDGNTLVLRHLKPAGPAGRHVLGQPRGGLCPVAPDRVVLE